MPVLPLDDGSRVHADMVNRISPEAQLDDHGDARSDATVLSAPFVTGTIEKGDDIDYFRMMLQSAKMITVYTTGDVDTIGILMKETDGNVEEIGYDNSTGNGTISG